MIKLIPPSQNFYLIAAIILIMLFPLMALFGSIKYNKPTNSEIDYCKPVVSNKDYGQCVCIPIEGGDIRTTQIFDHPEQH